MQPVFRFKVSFYVKFHKEACKIIDVEETYCEFNNDYFVNLKIEQKIALEELDEKHTE